MLHHVAKLDFIETMKKACSTIWFSTHFTLSAKLQDAWYSPLFRALYIAWLLWASDMALHIANGKTTQTQP